MKVLLFGGSGMVGRELAHALAAHQVVAPSHTEVDIADEKSVGRSVDTEKPDFIINAAGNIDVGAIERDPISAERTNVQGAAVIACAAAQRAVPQLFMSSSYIFADSAEPYHENAVKSPTNEYGRTKAEAEDAVAACAAQSMYYIVRTSWIYSAYRGTFVDEVAKALLQGNTFEASAQRGNLTSAHDFAGAIVTHIIEDKKPGGVYHIVNEGGASRFEIAQEIARTLGVPDRLVKKRDFSPSSLRPSVLLSNTKLPPLPPWQAALRTYIMRSR